MLFKMKSYMSLLRGPRDKALCKKLLVGAKGVKKTIIVLDTSILSLISCALRTLHVDIFAAALARNMLCKYTHKILVIMNCPLLLFKI